MERNPDFDLDNADPAEWNRSDRNYYGWMDFRKRFDDQDDYLE